jgi:hypothetical protein
MAKAYNQTPATYYTDHKRKQVIRSLWCKTQIEVLSRILSKRLIYIGLPDLKALDVLEWIDYLEKVIAFQCTEYKGRKINVQELEDLLDKLERQNKLKSSVVYHGWMEEIVMGGLSKIGQIYQQADFLKVYNLDFCNNFTTPTKVWDENGRIIDIIHKTDAISKLMEYQRRNGDEGKGSRFIMYLTVNSDTFEENLTAIKDVYFKDYLKKIKNIRKPEVLAVRKMKAYCFYHIRQIFHKHDFQVEFLPPIFYYGSDYPNREKGITENHRMMTFTILGTRRRDSNEPLYHQNEEEFLNKQFIFANDSKIGCFKDKFIEEDPYDPDVLKILTASYTYKYLWQ